MMDNDQKGNNIKYGSEYFESYESEPGIYFTILREGLEFQLYFSIFIIAFSIFLSYIVLITRSFKIIKNEKKIIKEDLKFKRKASMVFLGLLLIRLIRICYFTSEFEQTDFFLFCFIEILKIINTILIPFVLKEQIKKNLIIPFKRNFILFWSIIFIESFYDLFVEYFYEVLFQIVTFNFLNFLCSGYLLLLFVKNPVKNYIKNNDYTTYMIELENKFPEALRDFYPNEQRISNNKSKTASPKKRPIISDLKKIKDTININKEVSDFQINEFSKIRNEQNKKNSKIRIFNNDINQNTFNSVNNSPLTKNKNIHFPSLNESYQTDIDFQNNNTKMTIFPKIEITFKDNYKFLDSNNSLRKYSDDDGKDIKNNYKKKNSHIFSDTSANLNLNSKERLTNKVCKSKNGNFNCSNSFYNSNKNKYDCVDDFNISNKPNTHFDDNKKGILEIAEKFFFVLTVSVRDMLIRKNLKKNLKEFFDLENSLKYEFFCSNNYYEKKIQEKVPRLKFPKKIKNESDFFKSYSINFQIFLKAIVNEPYFITEEVLKFLELSKVDFIKNFYKNERQKYINYTRFKDDTIQHHTHLFKSSSFISYSFDGKSSSESDDNDNFNNHENDNDNDNDNIHHLNSNFSITTFDNYDFIKKIKKNNTLDNSQIKYYGSMLINTMNNNNTMTSGFNNAISNINFYNSNTNRCNNFTISRTNDLYYSSSTNYKIKVDEINIFSSNTSNGINFNNFNFNTSHNSTVNGNINNVFNMNNNLSPTFNHTTSNNSKNLNTKVESSNCIINTSHTNNIINSNQPIISNVNTNLNANNSIILHNNNHSSGGSNNNSNQNININININTNLSFANFPLNNQELLQNNLNCLNYNICLNNNLIQPNGNGITSPKNNQNPNSNSNTDSFEGEIIINVTCNNISKILRKKLSDFRRFIHEVSEINKNNENIKMLNKLIKAENIVINNNLYNLSDYVLQNIFDNLNTVYKNDIFISEFFHDFYDDSFSYSRGLSITSNYYECSKKFIHFHRFYYDGKILSIKGEVKDIIMITVDFKTTNFYLICLWFDFNTQISGFKKEEIFLKYKYRELMEYICMMRSELGMSRLIYKNFKNENKKKEMKMMELDTQLKEIMTNKDFLKRDKWLEIFNFNKKYRQIKMSRKIKSSFTSYPNSFITASRDSLTNMTDI